MSTSFPQTPHDPMHYCLFDIDGTLLNSGGAGQAAMEAAIAEVFGTDRPIEGIATAGRTDHAITSDMFAYYGLEANDANRRTFIEAYLSHLPKQLASRPGLVLPGVVQLLAALSEREDVTLGLLTGNFRSGADAKLRHFELHAHFLFGGFGDEHLDRDDVAREAFVEVERHCGGRVECDRVWVIGDTPADVRCGRAIAANVVAVATGMYDADALRTAGPDHFFDDFTAFEAVVDLIR